MASSNPLIVSRRFFLNRAVRIAGTLALGAGTYAPSWVGSVSQGGLQHLTVAVAQPNSMVHLPLMLAQALGFFQAEGLQVELAAHATEERAVLSALRGNASAVACSYAKVFSLPARRMDLQAFLIHSKAPQVVLGASLKTLGRFSTPADLRGRRVGVLASDAIGTMVLTMVLRNVNIQPSEVSLVVAEDAAELIARYRAGNIDALSLNDPLVTMLEQRNEILVLADTRTVNRTRELLGGPVPGIALCAPMESLVSQAAACQSMANAVVQALKWMQTAGPGDLLGALRDGNVGPDRALYLAAFEKARGSYSFDGVMPVDAAHAALAVQFALDPTLRDERISLTRTYTNQFAQRAKARLRA